MRRAAAIVVVLGVGACTALVLNTGIAAADIAAVGDHTTFTFTGGIQLYNVPGNVSALTVEACGAQGGSGGGNGLAGGLSSPGGVGAKGGKAVGTIAVTPNEQLQVFVGGAGANGSAANVGGPGTGGFNRGGAGGQGFLLGGAGGGGGGASDVRRGPSVAPSHLIVAAGGGGGGGDALWKLDSSAEPDNHDGDGGAGGTQSTAGSSGFSVRSEIASGGGGGGGEAGWGGASGTAGTAFDDTGVYAMAYPVPGGGGGNFGAGGGKGGKYLPLSAFAGGGGGGGGGLHGGGGGGGGGLYRTVGLIAATPGGGGGGGTGMVPSGGTLTADACSGNGYVKITIPATLPPPGPPTAVAAAPSGGRSAIVSWSAPSAAEAVTGYSVTGVQDSTLTCATFSAQETACIVFGLDDWREYSFRVVANGWADSAASSPSNLVTPGVSLAPTDVVAVATVGGAALTWTPPLVFGAGTFEHYIARWERAGLSGECTSTLPECTMSGLQGGTQYTFTVRAVTSTVESGDTVMHTGDVSLPSNAVTPLGAPRVPSSVSASSSAPGKATVSFLPPANNGGAAITGYTASCSAPGRPTRTISGTGSPLTVASLLNGVTYSCKIKATNIVGSGPLSAAASVRVGAPGPPVRVSNGKGTTNGSIKVSWGAAAKNASNVTGYTTTCAPTTSGAKKSVNSTKSPANVTGLTRTKTYKCSVVAKNKYGTGPSASAPTATKPK